MRGLSLKDLLRRANRVLERDLPLAHSTVKATTSCTMFKKRKALVKIIS